MRDRWALGIFLMGVTNLALGATHDIRLYAAGSLRNALIELAAAYTQAYGAQVETTFSPSGLLRQRIESGERPDLFASANRHHPQALADAGIGAPVVLFARNELCALAQPSVDARSESLLDVLLDPDIRVGTSTPGADPSGDYAWAFFDRADAVRTGSGEALKRKARKLTGGADSPQPPAGRNNYAWVMENDRADVFLTYCTNARAAQAEVGSLQIVAVPPELAVGADYGLSLLAADNPAAVCLAIFILSPTGQRILNDHGFCAPLLPAVS